MADLTRVGGERYALLCALAYRQTLAGNKIAADANGHAAGVPQGELQQRLHQHRGRALPQAPFFLRLQSGADQGDARADPRLRLVATLAVRLRAARPGDVSARHGPGLRHGRRATASRMPVEESGNMLIMLAALARVEGNADLARKYWPTLDPLGRLPRGQRSGPGEPALLGRHVRPPAALRQPGAEGDHRHRRLRPALRAVGKPEEARKYMAIARHYAASWQEIGQGRRPHAAGLSPAGHLGHEAQPDLGPRARAEPVSRRRSATPRSPGISRCRRSTACRWTTAPTTSLIDWAVWSIAPAREPCGFRGPARADLPLCQRDALPRAACRTGSSTTDGRQKGFQARPVVGGIFVKLLADQSSWRNWAGRSCRGPAIP